MSESKLEYTSPVAFTRSQRLALFVIPPCASGALKVLLSTMKSETRNPEHWEGLIDSGKPFVISIFHETIVLAASFFGNTGFHTLTSYSYDGELAARFLSHFGIKALRGSSSRGGMKALSQLSQATSVTQAVGWTVDGPRGPRRGVKAGVALVAAKLDAPIIPVALAATKRWRLNSWDRFLIPKPFATLVCAYGEPIPPPPSSRREDIEQTRQEVERRLNALHDKLESEIDPEARPVEESAQDDES